MSLSNLKTNISDDERPEIISDPSAASTELRQAFDDTAGPAQGLRDGDQDETGADTDVVKNTAGASKIQSIGDVWADPMTWKKVQRVQTHISTLDESLNGGFVTGGVHLLVGRPGNCKTQLAVQIAVNAALKKTPVGFISLEMDKHEVSRLALAQLSGVSRIRIDNGLNTLSDKQAGQAIKDVISNSGGMPFQLIDGEEEARGFTRNHVERTIARGVRRWDWKLVVLDHLGELAPTDDDTSAQPLQADKSNIGSLRDVAKRHKVALVVVAPLRKASTLNDALLERLTLDDVLGSTNIGYAVCSCMAVAARRGEPMDPSFVRVRLLKNRKGPLPEGPLELDWKPACGRISDQKPILLPADANKNPLEMLRAIADSILNQ